MPDASLNPRGDASRAPGAEPSLIDLAKTGPGAPCSWCSEPIPEISDQGRRTRADARTCSQACRQKRARFVGGVKIEPSRVAGVAGSTDRSMAFAFADPPYPGFSQHYYGDHPDFAGEVDHAELLDRLLAEYPDGWALSTSSKTLAYVLQLCTERGIGAGSGRRPYQSTVRIGAWTRSMPPSETKRPLSAWEPVVFHGGREVMASGLLDWVYAGLPRDYPGKLAGIKPSAFSAWVFRCLGARPGDEMADLFPGSGAVGHAWEIYSGQADAA